MRTQPNSGMRFAKFPHTVCGFAYISPSRMRYLPNSRIRYAVLPICLHPGCGICQIPAYGMRQAKKNAAYCMREAAYSMRFPHTVCGDRIQYAVCLSWFVSQMCRVRIQYAGTASSMRSRIQYAVIFEVYWWTCMLNCRLYCASGCRRSLTGLLSALNHTALIIMSSYINYYTLGLGQVTFLGPQKNIERARASCPISCTTINSTMVFR